MPIAIFGMGGCAAVNYHNCNHYTLSSYSPLPLSPIEIAIKNGDLNTFIKELTNYSDQNEYKLFKLSVRKAAKRKNCPDRIKIVEILIQKLKDGGADLGALQNRDPLAISKAYKGENLDLIDCLYKHGLLDANSLHAYNVSSNINVVKKLYQLGAEINETSSCDSAAKDGDYECTKFLLEHGCDSNRTDIANVGKHYRWFNCPGVARLLLLYGSRIPNLDDDYFLRKRVYPALSKIMKAACLGDIQSFNNLHNELSDRDSLYNRITGSYEHKQGRLNAALRYAAANCKENMVKYLLYCGANQFAKCPDVTENVASTEDLIIRLRNREKSDSGFRASYDRIMYLFRNHKVSSFYRARKLYWQLRALAQNLIPDLIPNMITRLDPEITKQENPDLMTQQIEEIEKSFRMIHEHRVVASKK